MKANDARRMLYGNMAGAGHSAIGACVAPWWWLVRMADHCLYTHPAVWRPPEMDGHKPVGIVDEAGMFMESW